MSSGAWYQLQMLGARRPLRTFRADDDAIALAMALGLVKGQVVRSGGRGVRWVLHALTGGPRSELSRRVLA